MFESEACVADWERTGRVPVPARLLTPPDLTDLLAAGPPLVDALADECLALGDDAGLSDGLVGDAGGGDGACDGDGAHAGGGGGRALTAAADGVIDGNGVVGPGDAALDEGGRGCDGVRSIDAAGRGVADGDVLPADSADWAGLAPGVDLARLLSTVDVSGLSEFGLVEAVAGWERLAGWVAAEQALVLAELSGRPLFTQVSGFRDGIDPVSAVRMEVSARLRVSHREADARVVLAQELTMHRRATFDALHAGTIDLRRARILVEGVRVLDDAAAARVEARLVPDAGEHTPAGFRRRVERAVAAADPAGFEDRHARAVEDRQVRCRPEPDGMGSVWALLPAADTAMINTVLDAAADAARHDHPDDARTHAQRRADALAQLAWAAWHTGSLPGGPGGGPRLATAQGRRVEIGVLVPFPTLIGGGRGAGGNRRVRADPGVGGPPDRGGRDLAADPHRPGQRAGPRLRHDPLPATAGPDRPCDRQGSDLPRHRLRPAGPIVSDRPHDSLSGRADRGREHRPVLRPAAPVQNGQ
jgi:Domain of unknown function (DUF222)